ncbi:hypothetical protein POTOM_009274 [Populus tomentosa]|uniref:ceramidase n=1 Tax=Populus tomentosa TaxID=118781 RepID=A0A8X8AAS1_POPTO|nr:hypothetical protein POTOM_009274 [Populus tomentosa]
MSATKELTGKFDYRHAYQNFTISPGFAAGTTDGPGMFGFQQGDSEINELWKKVRDLLKEPSQFQVECQKPKAVLLSSGEMFEPYAWTPEILPIQILRLGKLIILSVPGELTTMAGRRLREAVKETLAASTLYGSHTLSAYIQEFNHLALAMAKGRGVLQPSDWSPPDLSSKWKLDNSSLYTSLATIEREVPEEASSGVYRLRHFGSSKEAQHSPIEYFTGASSAFTVS